MKVGSWSRSQTHNCSDNNSDRACDAKRKHRHAPADGGNTQCDNRRPQGACYVLSTRYERNRGPAPTVEPTTDVDYEGNIDSSAAKNSQQEAMSYQQLPRSALGS